MHLLGRQVLPYELVLDEFKEEIQRAWTYGVGCTSEREGKERLATNIRTLLDIAIAGASPEVIHEAMRLAREQCPCPNCVARRSKRQKAVPAKRRRGKAKRR